MLLVDEGHLMLAPLQARNDSDAVQTETARTAKQARRFVDKRPAAVAQRKLAEMLNNSPRVLPQRAQSGERVTGVVTQRVTGFRVPVVKQGSFQLMDKRPSSQVQQQRLQAMDNNRPRGVSIQMRTINGKITTERTGGNWHVKPMGASAPPNLSISPSPKVNMGTYTKAVLTGEGDLMRGHLVKAAWEGKNDMEQMTQWNLSVEEVAWTNIEALAEAEAVKNAGKYKGKQQSLTHNVKTTTDDPAIGNRLLGADTSAIPVKWLKDNAIANAGSAVVVDGVRNELNRMVTTAKMEVANVSVGNIASTAHNGLSVKG